MIILPAIDLYEKKAVRLLKGDYANMTVYSDDPLAIARDFVSFGATHIHMVDLEGAKDGTTPNLDVVTAIAQEQAVGRYGSRIAVGADVKDGFIAIKGWLEKSALSLEDFLRQMQALGVKNIICTDISKDGAMKGTNLALYQKLSEHFTMDLTASGGVSSMDDVKNLKEMNLYGAIIGKAYYTGAIDLKEAIEVAK